jgi:SAM-dependent methyltransferase
MLSDQNRASDWSDLVGAVERCCVESFQGIFPPSTDYRRVAEEFVSEARCTEQCELLARLLPWPLAGKRLLEVGSGYGMFVATARRKFGLDAYGVEPGEQFLGTLDLSRRLLRLFDLPADAIVQGTGEAIPFPDGQFDIVYSCNVLEHVADPAQVLAESLRVLRRGGMLVVNVPNYGSWWEGHYGVLFLPHCPKWLFKAMMRAIGRDPAFIDTLQFVTYARLQAWLAPHAGQLRVAGFGAEVWEQRLRSLVFSEWATLGTLKRIVRWVHKLRLVEPVIWLGLRLHWETPFIVVIEKK